jgi:hypothetical protein
MPGDVVAEQALAQRPFAQDQLARLDPLEQVSSRMAPGTMMSARRSRPGSSRRARASAATSQRRSV